MPSLIPAHQLDSTNRICSDCRQYQHSPDDIRVFILNWLIGIDPIVPSTGQRVPALPPVKDSPEIEAGYSGGREEDQESATTYPCTEEGSIMMSSDRDLPCQDGDSSQDAGESSASDGGPPCLRLNHRRKLRHKHKRPKAPPTHTSTEDESSDQASSSENDIQCIKHRLKKHKHHDQHSKPKRSPPRDDTSTDNPPTSDTNTVGATDTETSTTASEAAEPPAPAPAPSDPDWTLSEDAILRGMKTDERSSASWREIAKALRKSQQACKARWKVLQAIPGAAIPDHDDDDDTTPAPASAPPATRRRGQPMRPDREEEAEDSLDEEDYTYGFGDLEQRRQNRYFHRHILGTLYPPTRRHPDPDANFPRRDCDILAACESRREHVKWLEMQANFYNVTGRMIPLHVIRDRCDQGKERTRIESWARNVAQEKQLDPRS